MLNRNIFRRASLAIVPILLIILMPVNILPESYASILCGISTGSLSFGNLAINSLSTFGSPNTTLVLNNTGLLPARVSVSGTNWADGLGSAHLPVGNTVYAIPTPAKPVLTGSTASVSTTVSSSTGAISSTFNPGNMTALTTSAVSIGTVGLLSQNTTYWQVATVPGGGVTYGSSFNGALTQTITLTVSCP